MVIFINNILIYFKVRKEVMIDPAKVVDKVNWKRPTKVMEARGFLV